MTNYKKPGLKKPSGSLQTYLAFPFPVILAVALLLLPAKPAVSEEPVPAGINLLIADLTDNTGDPDLAMIVKPILHWTLQQSDRLAVYPEIKARRFLKENFQESNDGMTISRARQLCLDENIPVILVPGINRLDESLIISAKLIYIKENRELFVDTLRVKNLNHLAVTVENLSKRIRQSLGESWGSPAMTGDIFSTGTTFKVMDLFSRSFSFYAYNSRRDAMECLENVLELDPDMAAAQLHLGILHLRLQRPREALQYISKAKNSSANLPEKYRCLIDGLYDFLTYRYREAAARFRSYAAAFPHDWQAHFLLGRCASVLGDYPEAIEEYRTAVALDDTRIESRIGLGLALLYNRDPLTARRILEQATVLYPEDPETRMALGLLELVENYSRYAIEAFEQTKQLPLYRSISTSLLAQTDIYRGKFKDALDLLAAGIKEDHKNRDVFAEASKRLVRARIYLLTGNTPDAVSECLRIPDAANDPVLMAEQGSILAEAGRPADAEKTLQHLRTMQSSPFIRALADSLLGEIHSAEGRLKEATQSFLRAKETIKAPSASLARVLMQTEKWERAAAEFAEIREQKAAMLFPHHRPWFAGIWVRALYEAGQCSLESNNPEDAKQYFRQYLWVMESADPSLETLQKAEILLTGESLR
ncbi:MAG: tetratricopeptide repeat protein [Acidobacteria bacterium]|nr:tetratricopeptide repeat protein [Acidobacteriota bacterium]